jgi:hypothetical protein
LKRKIFTKISFAIELIEDLNYEKRRLAREEREKELIQIKAIQALQQKQIQDVKDKQEANMKKRIRERRNRKSTEHKDTDEFYKKNNQYSYGDENSNDDEGN